MQSKYVCRNCGKTDARYIRAMIEAGFQPRQIACRECGQQEIRERETEDKRESRSKSWVCAR